MINENEHGDGEVRILGRLMGEELSLEELEQVTGGDTTDTNTDNGQTCDR